MIMTNKAILRGMIRLESDCYYLWPACYALHTPCVHSTPLSIHSNQRWLESAQRWSAYQTMSHTLTCELAVCQSSWEKYIPDQEEALFQNANMWGMAFFMMCCDDRLSYDDSTLTFKNMILWENAMTQNWPGAFSQTIFIYCSIMCLRSSGQECDRINALAEHHWSLATCPFCNQPTNIYN